MLLVWVQLQRSTCEGVMLNNLPSGVDGKAGPCAVGDANTSCGCGTARTMVKRDGLLSHTCTTCAHPAA